MKAPLTPSRKRLWFWWIVLLVLLGIGVFLAILLNHLDLNLEKSQPGLYRVVKFDDGDTIQVDMNGTTETVRLIGVDTPETHKPDTPVQCYGPDAAIYTKQLIGNQRVRLQADPLNTNRDRYGRLLRYVYLPDNTLVEQKLISEGYGFAYTYFPSSKNAEFSAYEQAAKSTGKGLWTACQVTIESNGVKQTQALSP